MTSAADDRLFEVLDASPVGVCLIAADRSPLFINRMLRDMLGQRSDDELASMARHGFMRDESLFDAALSELAVRGSVRAREAELAGSDGRWSSITVQPLALGGGDGFLIWFYDVTEQRRARHDLEASEDALLSVLEAAPIGATVLDAEGRVMFWNTRLIDILDAQGAAFTDAASLVFEGDTTIRDTLLQEMREHGRVRDYWISLDRKDQWPLSALVSMEPVTFERLPGVLTWIYDVSELRRAQEVSEAATRAKSAFLATVSHEIRTPMNGVITMAELLGETNLSRDQAAMVNTIREAGQSLLVIINDILDFSKIEAGRLDIERVACAPRQLVTSVAALLSPRASDKGLDFVIDVTDDVPPWLVTDPTRVRQVLLNMIGNAIKFTDRGEVAVRASVTDDRRRLKIAVRDTGIGMTEATLENLFQSFSQGDVSTARRFGGTGLGLSICRGLVELMGGNVQVTSVLGVGSTFWFEIPLEPCDAPISVQTIRSGTKGVRWHGPNSETARAEGTVILCAEDNSTNREVLRRVLDRLGFPHEMVDNGRDALKALKRGGYGLLLTDCHMPEMDGFALASAVRTLEAQTGGRRLPIIALTADVVAGTEERCHQAGMDSYVTKPVSLGSVEQVIAQWLPRALELRSIIEDSDEVASAANDPDDILDLAVLVELVGDDPVEIGKILAEFLVMAEDKVALITGRTAATREEAHRAAHSLKSAARYIGGNALADIAADIEQALGAGDETTADQAITVLIPAFDALKRAIANMALGQQLVELQTEIAELADDQGETGTGVELAAVVDITEQAASRILEAAEAIAERVERLQDTEQVRLIQGQLTAIFEACAFQDLTSQRVRRAIARLAAIEQKLFDAVRKMSLETVVSGGGDGEGARPAPAPKQTQDQAQIDKLFAVPDA